ncbi:MAG: exo-alpha-sialidase [Bacteroidota bacterium]
MRFFACFFLLAGLLACQSPSPADAQLPPATYDLFPPQAQHVHGSTILALPNGDLLAAWFHGSGERQADDVAILGARFDRKDQQWSAPFPMADVPDFPDINPVLFFDGEDRLWLMWYTVLANQWETSILRYRISEDYLGGGPPNWYWQESLFVKPGGSTERGIPADDAFVKSVRDQFAGVREGLNKSDAFLHQPVPEAEARKLFEDRVAEILSLAKGEDLKARGRVYQADGSYETQPMGYPRFRRMGWQTRNRPLVLASGRIIVPLYSDGFDFSLMAITDDGGQHWHFSEPIVSLGGVQPALLQRTDGSLYTLMRDNGPPPQRLLTGYSEDEGEHWSWIRDSELPNPGSAAELLALQDGRWLLAHNDTENGRHALALSVSADEGNTWELWQHAEQDSSQQTRFHYPALSQDRLGNVHLSYSVHGKDAAGHALKTIRHRVLRP